MTGAPRLDRSPAPPRAALWLLRIGLDAGAYETIAGDLLEEFAVEVGPRAGRRAARRWFWRQAWSSVVARRTRRRAIVEPAARTGAIRMPSLLQDLRYGWRTWRAHPGFALAAACTLALGIGATTTVFGLVNALVLRPLPYHDPGRVAFLLGWNTARDQMRFNLPYADSQDLAARRNVFEQVAVYRGWTANLSGGGLPERVTAYRVSANTFRLLGVDAALGRTFAPDEAEPGHDRVVVLSHGLWTRRFGGDPGVVGRTIELNGAPYTVVGVMPRAFEFPVFNFKGDLWTPLAIDASWTPPVRADSPWVVAIARLAPGATPASAQTDAAAVMRRLAAEHPKTNAALGVRVVPMGTLGSQQAGAAFAAMAVAVLLVLLVACANVANLLLARSLARGREMAVRAALGAGRGRLVRQLLVESLLLALAGGALGAVAAWWALGALRRAMPEFVFRVLPGVDAIRLDGTALAFALAVSLATVLVFGLVPAWQTVGPRLADALKTGGRTATARRRGLSGALVVVEVTVSVALVVTTGLLDRSVRNLLAHDPGFDKDHVLAFSLTLPEDRYGSGAARETFFDELTARVGALPGVDAAGMVNTLPFSTSDETIGFTVDGEAAAEGARPAAGYRIVSPGYLDALGVPLERGRTFTAADGPEGPAVAVVNRAFARAYLGGGAAIGRRLRLGDEDADATPVTVVGVVGDVQHQALSDAPRPEIYVPYRLDRRSTMSFAARTAGAPASVAQAVRAAVAGLDANLAVYDVAPLSRLVANSIIPQTLASSTMTVFGLAALLLASLGLYGVLAFLVSQRASEIGVRLALGATRGDVLRLVLGRSLVLAAGGLALGLAAAAVAARGLASLLYGVAPFDPATYAATAAVLLLVALAATVAPARRAMAVDPVTALRAE